MITALKSGFSAGATLTLLLLLFSVAQGDGGFGIKPTRPTIDKPESRSFFLYDLEPGRVHVDDVTVTNTDNTSVTLKVYPTDAYTIQNGGIGFKGPNDTLKTGGWITIGASLLTLEPGHGATIPFTITVPTDTVPGQYTAGLVVQNIDLQTFSGQFAFNIVRRAAVLVLAELPGERTRLLEIGGMRQTVENGMLTFVADLFNNGNTLIAPSGSFVISNTNGSQLRSFPLAVDTILGQDQTTYSLRLTETLPAGKYWGLLELNYDTPQPAVFGPWEFTISGDELREIDEAAKRLEEARQREIGIVVKSDGWQLFVWRSLTAVIGLVFLSYLGIKNRWPTRLRNRLGNSFLRRWF